MTSKVQSNVSWLAAGAVCGVAGATLLQRLALLRRSPGTCIAGTDFRGRSSKYIRSGSEGVVGLLAYDICEPLTKEEYDRWLFDVHYHDLMANPHLDKIVLRTVSKDKKAMLSSGAAVTNDIEFYRLAELHFKDYSSYDEYIAWFRANAIPPPRTPVGKSAFRFYLLSEAESILRAPLGQPAPPATPAAEASAGAAPRGPPPARTGPPVVLVVGSTGHIGAELARQLRERGDVKVVEASRSPSGEGAVRLDIHDEASVRALDDALPDGIDHVAICCGASTFGPLGSFDSKKWAQSCHGKLMAVSRLVVMLTNGQELRCLRDSGSITVTTGQAGRTVNRMWPGIAANNAGLEAMVRCAGVDAPRSVRINAVAPALVRETAVKAGLPLEGTVPAAEAAAAFIPLMLGESSGLVVDAGTQTLFNKSHHSAQKDGTAPTSKP